MVIFTDRNIITNEKMIIDRRLIVSGHLRGRILEVEMMD
jgi:hypothetical protein